MLGLFGAKKKSINLKQVQYLLVHDPLKIVRLEHSARNKALILKGLEVLSRDPQGAQIFKTLSQFLEYAAPRHDLTPDQEGARKFLLRALEQVRAAGSAGGKR